MPARKNKTTDKAKIIRIIENLPFDEEDQKRWIEIINESELEEFIIKEMKEKIAEFQEPTEDEILDRKRLLSELNLFLRRWRLSQNLNQFQRRR